MTPITQELVLTNVQNSITVKRVEATNGWNKIHINTEQGNFIMSGDRQQMAEFCEIISFLLTCSIF